VEDHAHDLTYTVVLPRAHPWMELSAPASYEQIHRGVRAVLAAAGIASELTPTASAQESEACFQKPVKFDLVAGTGATAQKLSGAAQRRTREGMLHQGSILLPEPAANDAVRAAFPQAFAASLGLDLSPGELTSAERERATALERDRYSTDAWNRSR
jgi:lipoate-protein ligase A